MNTIKINACPKCGAPVPPEAPQGLCPRCVMAAVAAPEAAPTATSQIPSLERLAVAFPQLQVLELIGRGGMGFVFKARQPHLDRFVALKLLPDSLAHDPQFAERFNREGRVLARLNHPNIVSIFDFGQAGGFYYLMMEYVDGVNLRQAMQAGRFSPAEALTIVPKICEALQFAHEEGILHRDIKPENILLDSKGRIKIADFGIAKLIGEDKPDISLTATGAALGTMHYMAPEQIEKPSTVDHRADIYSLGVVFYELLTGELPLGRFGPPSARTPVDPRVDDVVMRTLEREREKRFQSAGEMKTNVEHLTEVGAGAAVQALTPADDFILCPPRLPRMAKAIIVYALVLAPLFWLLGLFTIEPLPDHALVKFVQGALNVLISGVEFLVLIVLAIGGWKLRGLRPSAPTWLKTGLWLHFSLMLLAIAGQIYVERLASELIRNAPLKRPVLADGIMLAAGLACIVFEISAFVWLRRHTALLKSLCPPAAKSSGPRGTMVIKPGAVVPSVPQWSLKAVWGAVLVGISLLPMVAMGLLAVYLATSRHGGAIGGWEMILILIAILPGITGTVLGWMGLSDVRAHAGQRRGLSLAVFAALALPLGLLLLMTFVAPLWFYFVYVPAQNGGALPIISATLMLLVPAGTLTFAIWAVYATARWSANQPAPERRGKLKWIFAGLMACGVGYIALASLQHVQRTRAYYKANEDRLPNPPMAAVDTNTTPWIRFTFTAVELREEKGVRWLAIDYLDDVHGECQKSFPWENTIPGFTATTRATEFLKESKDFSPEVRHQRIEYRMPDSSPRDQLERLRDNLDKALKQKSFRLELGENEVPLLLFELPGVEGGSLQARIKVVPPLKIPVGQPQGSVTGTGQSPLTYAWRAGNRGQLTFATTNATQSFAYGPVVIRTLSFNDSLQDGFLDLDTGRLLTPPKDIVALFKTAYGIRVEWERKSDPRAEKMREWLRASGANLMACGGEYPERLEMREGVALTPTANSNGVIAPFGFDQADANYLVTRIEPMLESFEKQRERSLNIQQLQPGFYEPLNMRQDSFCFRTREGAVGILQILNTVNNQRGVQIRYKLVQPAPILTGWLRGAWIYDKEYSTRKTAELRAATVPPQKSLQDVVNGIQKSGGTNTGAPDVAKITGDMTAMTMGMMTTMKDTVELQVILDLLSGSQLTFEETEVRSVSRLAAPAVIRYDEIKVINPTTMQVRWQGTNGGDYNLEGERFRVDVSTPNGPFAFYFKRLQPEYLRAAADLEILRAKEQELSATLTDEHPQLRGVRRLIIDLEEKLARLKKSP